jgi:transcriptional regulator with XRE-family HTH domain
LRLDPEKVRRAREILGYAIEATGEKGDLSPNSVLRAEHGEEIRPSTARRLAKALNREVADLYPKEQAPTSPTSAEAVSEERRTAGAGDDELPAGQSQRQAAIKEAQEAIGALLKESGIPVRYLTMPREELEALYDAATIEEAQAITTELVAERQALDNLHSDALFPGWPTRAIYQNLGTAFAGMKMVKEREATAAQEVGEEDLAQRIREAGDQALLELTGVA